MWSFDTGENTFRDLIADSIGDLVTKEHEQHDVNLDLSWFTGAAEDTDFWEWFWQWYATIDETWTFDHEVGFVLTDPEYAWEWF